MGNEQDIIAQARHCRDVLCGLGWWIGLVCMIDWLSMFVDRWIVLAGGSWIVGIVMCVEQLL